MGRVALSEGAGPVVPLRIALHGQNVSTSSSTISSIAPSTGATIDLAQCVSGVILLPSRPDMLQATAISNSSQVGLMAARPVVNFFDPSISGLEVGGVLTNYAKIPSMSAVAFAR